MYSDSELATVIETVNRLGSQRQAAKELGLSRRALQRRLYAAREDNSVLTRASSEAGFDPANVKAYWVKREDGSFYIKNERELEDKISDIRSALMDDLPKAEPVIPFFGNLNDDLLNCFVISDYHLGMLAWGEETRNADWDLHIAEELLVKWFAAAIHQSPDAKTAVLMQLGDFLHYDGMESVTPMHNNILDADSRPQKMIRVAIRAIRKVIEMLLEKHEQVFFYNVEGNHDPYTTAMMKEMWKAFYEDEPRIIVDDSPDIYHAHEFGDVSLFMHHGHRRNLTNVDHVFASKFREMFGRTKHSYAHLGHLHQQAIKESNLMIIEQHPTLAPEDAYAAKGGWGHKRNAKVITYHRKFGEVSRQILSAEMVS